MTERGILMTPENYGKCEAGTKTQTRRIVKVQPKELSGAYVGAWHWQGGKALIRAGYGANYVHTNLDAVKDAMEECCPYGVPGDRLYVKESHYRYGRWFRNGKTTTGKQRWRFKASPLAAHVLYDASDIPSSEIGKKRSVPRNLWWKRSPLFMPKWAARLWLELTDVRVERLQEISEKDAAAEGVKASYPELDEPASAGGEPCKPYRAAFRCLWESNKIHKPGSWDLNPWVWVLSFKKVKP